MMLNSDRYCTIHPRNFRTHSDEYASILILCAVHFEYSAKLYLKLINDKLNTDHMNMRGIHEAILRVRPNMPKFAAKMPYHSLTTQPLIEWTDPNRQLPWWQAYNNIKHDFVTNIQQADQMSALNALSSCLCVLLYYYEGCMDRIQTHTSLFYYDKPKTWITNDGWEVLP